MNSDLIPLTKKITLICDIDNIKDDNLKLRYNNFLKEFIKSNKDNVTHKILQEETPDEFFKSKQKGPEAIASEENKEPTIIYISTNAMSVMYFDNKYKEIISLFFDSNLGDDDNIKVLNKAILSANSDDEVFKEQTRENLMNLAYESIIQFESDTNKEVFRNVLLAANSDDEVFKEQTREDLRALINEFIKELESYNSKEVLTESLNSIISADSSGDIRKKLENDNLLRFLVGAPSPSSELDGPTFDKSQEDLRFIDPITWESEIFNGGTGSLFNTQKNDMSISERVTIPENPSNHPAVQEALLQPDLKTKKKEVESTKTVQGRVAELVAIFENRTSPVHTKTPSKQVPRKFDPLKPFNPGDSNAPSNNGNKTNPDSVKSSNFSTTYENGIIKFKIKSGAEYPNKFNYNKKLNTEEKTLHDNQDATTFEKYLSENYNEEKEKEGILTRLREASEKTNTKFPGAKLDKDFFIAVMRVASENCGIASIKKEEDFNDAFNDALKNLSPDLDRVKY